MNAIIDHFLRVVTIPRQAVHKRHYWRAFGMALALSLTLHTAPILAIDLPDKLNPDDSDASLARSKGKELGPLNWTNNPSQNPPKFYYPNPMRPYMRRLNETYKISQLVAGAKSDLERTRIICDWVNQQWSHKGDCPVQKNDPIAILESARTGNSFSCYEYSLVTSGCLNSIGIKSRTVILLPKDVERRPEGNYHVVTEAYLNDRKKWVMVDAQWNAIPVLNNYPLSVVELQNAVARSMGGINLGNVKNGMEDIYLISIPVYIHYVYTPIDNRVIGAKTPENVSGGVLLVPAGEKPPASFASAPIYNKITITNSIPDFYGAGTP